MTAADERVIVPGGRWLHRVRGQFSMEADKVAHPNRYQYREGPEAMGAETTYHVGSTTQAQSAERLVAILDDPETRRVIIDARQAALFVEAQELPPVQGQYRLPFNQMYIEFTEPVRFTETAEPGFEDDLCVAIVVAPDYAATGLRAMDRDELVAVPVGVTLIKYNERTNSWVDQGFVFDLLSGRGYTTVHSARAQLHEPSVFPEDFPLDSNDRHWMQARPREHGGGWWEQQVYGHATFFAWLATYMTAKGIVVVEETLSRQVRRAQERMRPQDRPTPWHVVMVDPMLVREQQHAEGESGRKHSYRYDVRGHLRFGRHRRGDGTYSHTVEWIAPHQRGLANAVYVPKTLVFERKVRGQ